MRLQTIKPTNIGPTGGLSGAAHLGLLVLLPIMMFIFVRGSFVELALALVLLSKWRMFVVQPRFWLANIRANAVDIMVGLSTLVFMSHTDNYLTQLLWAAAYAIWQIYIKPLSGMLGTSTQAAIGQLAALSALFVFWPDGPLYGIVGITGFICYLSARHFFDGFDEAYARLYSYIWAYFGAALLWITGHWLIFYGVLAQPTLILSVLGYGTSGLYYLDHYERLSTLLRRQLVAIMIVIAVLVFVLSWIRGDWGSKVL